MNFLSCTTEQKSDWLHFKENVSNLEYYKFKTKLFYAFSFMGCVFTSANPFGQNISEINAVSSKKLMMGYFCNDLWKMI